MKETREQMKRLMEKIQMPEEGIAQLLEARKELEEAAVVDGYNSYQIFTKIIVPISKPIFASCAIVCLNHVWNEFLFANVFL